VLQVFVRGGTRAGRRIIKDERTPWDCVCGEHNPRFRANCGGCKKPRPE
jgi:hypothetical protein